MARIITQDTQYNINYTSPITSRNYTDRIFKIDFKDSFDWLADNRKISHPKYTTVSEMSRGHLHELLDQFINELSADENKNTTIN